MSHPNGREPAKLLILLCVSIPSFMLNLDANLVAVSLPSIAACELSTLWNGPNRIASAAPVIRSKTLRAMSSSSAGQWRLESTVFSRRTAITTAQNIGRASSLASAPEVPRASEAPRVTKLPVT
jgi:hypothetical protein